MNTRTIIIILAALAILNIASAPREHRTGTAAGITSNLQVIDQTYRGQTKFYNDNAISHLADDINDLITKWITQAQCQWSHHTHAA